MKPTITEAEFERMADQRIQALLSRDPRYIHAENAEEQSEAEATIEAEVVRDLEERYTVNDYPVRPDGPETAHGGLIGQQPY